MRKRGPPPSQQAQTSQLPFSVNDISMADSKPKKRLIAASSDEDEEAGLPLVRASAAFALVCGRFRVHQQLSYCLLSSI